MSFDMKQFVKERDEVLKSLDKQKIIAYCKKYGATIPDNDMAFWGGMHKARLGIRDITLDEQVQSAFWLLENGFKLPEFTQRDVIEKVIEQEMVECLKN